MKKPKHPTHGWRLFRGAPADHHGVHKLYLSIVTLRPRGEDYHAFPNQRDAIPRYNHDSDIEIELHWQANVGDVFPGTLDGPDWYGCRIEVKTRDFTDLAKTHAVLQKWFGRAPLAYSQFSISARGIIDRLAEHRIPRIAYYPAASDFILAEHWSIASAYGCYYDIGARSPERGEGCLVNAFCRDGDDPAAAISTALRQSRYCTDDDYARWIQNGRQWRCAYRPGESTQHAPLPLTHYFGQPIPEAASPEAWPAAA